MNLVIDIGNSQAKSAVFDGSEILYSISQPATEPVVASEMIKKYPLKNAILSTVRGADKEMISLLTERLGYFLRLDATTPLPFENLYKTTGTLGMDRLAAAAGAGELYPGENVLVIDLGSAITIDLLNSRNQFTGGNISPGMRMRFSALNHFTAGLPLAEPGETDDFPGQTTAGAIRAGVISGIVFEVDEYINRLSTRYTNLKVVATGGDADFFVKKLKNHIFVDSNLVLRGLNRILAHNEKLR
jgi:type III pantothenate kinase